MLNFSEELKTKLQQQHHQMWNLEMNVSELFLLCKIVNKNLKCTWYLISQDPQDKKFLYGIVEEESLIIKSISLDYLESITVDGAKCELDPSFTPVKVRELFQTND